MTRSLRFDCMSDPAAWDRLASEWDELLASMPRPSPFLSSTWLSTWWEHFGGSSQLWLLTARDEDGRLLGGAPLRLVRHRVAGMPVRTLELLGYRGSAVCADHLGFLCRPEGGEAVLAALAGEILRRRRDWDVIVLADLAEGSGLPRAFATSGAHREETPAEVCYFIPLPAQTAELWSQLKAAHPQLVSNVMRYRRRIARDIDMRFIPEALPGEREAVMEALVRLHALARARKGEGGNFRRDDYRAFHFDLMRRLAAAERLYLARLECDGEIAAVLYGFVEGGVLYFYQSGFDTRWDKFGVGKLLLAAILEDAVERLGTREFDFLRGEEDYKTRWCSQLRRTSVLMVWGSSPAARLDALVWRTRRRLRPLRSWVAGRLARWRAGSSDQGSTPAGAT